MTKCLISTITILSLFIHTAQAYVNGGDKKTTLSKELGDLKKEGWVAVAKEGNDPRSEKYEDAKLNELVAIAIKNLPEDAAKELTGDDKRELVRLLKESFQGRRTGQLKGIEYRLGTISYLDIYGEYRRDQRIGEKKYSRCVPLVALRVANVEDGKGQ